MILTEQIIESGKSENGGWSLAQLKCLGIKDFKSGWKKLVIGKSIGDAQIKKFINLKNAHLK